MIDDFPVFDEFEVERKEDRRAVDRLSKAVADLDQILKTFVAPPKTDQLAAFNDEFLEIIEESDRRRGGERRKQDEDY